MAIAVGIDGTGGGFVPGQSFNNAYDRDFQNSFVRRLCGGGSPNKRYFRGPVALGGGLPEAIEGGYNFIHSRYQMPGAKPAVLLTGYSRGGCGVIVIAERLKVQKIPVAAMILFDAVDRHLAFDAETIPNNVAHVVHVRRNPNAQSRNSFGNCGTKFSPPTKYTESFYWCTHGGMGGTPWKISVGKAPNDYIEESFPDGKTLITYAGDATVSAKIWNDVSPFAASKGFF